MNPSHTIPTMKDGDFVLTQSRAMVTYLATKYGNDGCMLYPAAVETRAKIDDCLYFDATSFYDAFGKTVVCTTIKTRPRLRDCVYNSRSR